MKTKLFLTVVALATTQIFNCSASEKSSPAFVVSSHENAMQLIHCPLAEFAQDPMIKFNIEAHDNSKQIVSYDKAIDESILKTFLQTNSAKQFFNKKLIKELNNSENLQEAMDKGEVIVLNKRYIAMPDCSKNEIKVRTPKKNAWSIEEKSKLEMLCEEYQINGNPDWKYVTSQLEARTEDSCKTMHRKILLSKTKNLQKSLGK